MGIALDVGPGFYLSRGRTAPWLGVDVGIRLGPGDEKGAELTRGVGGFLAGGVVFRRGHSIRVHLTFQAGAVWMAVPAMSVAGMWGVPEPSRSSFLMAQGNVAVGVGF